MKAPLIAYTELHGAQFQVSIHKDPRANGDKPYHVMLFGRESEYLGRGPDEGFYPTLHKAKRSCYRRFGIPARAWKDAYETSAARSALETFAHAQGRKVTRPRAWPLTMTQTREYIVAAARIEHADRRIMLEAGDTVLCATMKAVTGVIFEVLHKNRVSRYSEEFPLRWEGFNLLEVERYRPEKDASYCIWVEQAFEREFFAWFPYSECDATLEEAHLTMAEDLLIRYDDITFVFEASRTIEAALDFMIRVAEQLPGIQLPPGGFLVEGLIMDPATVPEVLRPIIPLTKRWAIGDDKKRTRRFAKASARTKERLIHTVKPLFPEIERYLDSFGDDPIPEEAALIMHLAEGVAEMR